MWVIANLGQGTLVHDLNFDRINSLAYKHISWSEQTQRSTSQMRQGRNESSDWVGSCPPANPIIKDTSGYPNKIIISC
jgi:hypothetical protein